jgi:translation initiation factor IF-1
MSHQQYSTVDHAQMEIQLFMSVIMAAVYKRSRGKIWIDEETKVLIDLWGEEDIQVALDNAKTSRASSQVYKTLLVS